jgi:hypothetical protein
MSGGFVDILVVVLFAAFAIGSIIVIFAVAGKVFHEIMEAFQRSMLAGVGMLCLSVVALLAVFYAARFVSPYVVEFCRGITG